MDYGDLTEETSKGKLEARLKELLVKLPHRNEDIFVPILSFLPMHQNLH